MKKSAYIRHSIIADPNEFLQHIEMHHTKNNKILINGIEIKLGSDRYKVFKFKGMKCVHCPAEGSFLAIETFKTKSKTLTYHINLYGKDENGDDLLFTKDHIMPKKLGGKDFFDNYQPMCEVCNTKKGHISPDVYIISNPVCSDF